MAASLVIALCLQPRIPTDGVKGSRRLGGKTTKIKFTGRNIQNHARLYVVLLTERDKGLCTTGRTTGCSVRKDATAAGVFTLTQCARRETKTLFLAAVNLTEICFSSDWVSERWDAIDAHKEMRRRFSLDTPSPSLCVCVYREMDAILLLYMYTSL